MTNDVSVRATRAIARFLIRTPLASPFHWMKRAEIARGLDRDSAAMIALGDLTGDTRLASRSAHEARQSLRRSVALSDADPCASVHTRDLEVEGAAGPLRARLYTLPTEPADRPHGPAMMFIHGGGWVTGDLDTHDGFCRTLALLGQMRVIAIEPRLAPEHRFPAAYDDSVSAFRHLVSRADELRIDVERFAVGGDSAGGNLSAGVGLATREDHVRPRLALLIYPGCDATMSHRSIQENARGYILEESSIHWYLANYAPASVDRKDPRLSPLWAPSVHGAPPSIVVAAGFDPLRDEALAYAEKLERDGVTVEVQHAPSLPHGFILFTGLSRAAHLATDAMCVRAGELLRK
jgi:acetyl esterase